MAGGRGVCQMSILLHKPYLVKLSTKGGGGSKMPKILSTWFMDDPQDEIDTVVLIGPVCVYLRRGKSSSLQNIHGKNLRQAKSFSGGGKKAKRI